MSSQPADDNWQPIETAPRDGTRVLLYMHYRSIKPALRRNSIWTGYWHKGWRAVGAMGTMAATHWQPLPNPPEVSDE